MEEKEKTKEKKEGTGARYNRREKWCAGAAAGEGDWAERGEEGTGTRA